MGLKPPYLFEEVRQHAVFLARDIVSGFKPYKPSGASEGSWLLATAHVVDWYRRHIVSGLLTAKPEEYALPFPLDPRLPSIMSALSKSMEDAEHKVRRNAFALLENIPAQHEKHVLVFPNIARRRKMTPETRVNAEFISRRMVSFAEAANQYTANAIVDGCGVSTFLRPEKVAERANATMALGF